MWRTFSDSGVFAPHSFCLSPTLFVTGLDTKEDREGGREVQRGNIWEEGKEDIMPVYMDTFNQSRNGILAQSE